MRSFLIPPGREPHGVRAPSRSSQRSCSRAPPPLFATPTPPAWTGARRGCGLRSDGRDTTGPKGPPAGIVIIAPPRITAAPRRRTRRHVWHFARARTAPRPPALRGRPTGSPSAPAPPRRSKSPPATASLSTSPNPRPASPARAPAAARLSKGHRSPAPCRARPAWSGTPFR